MAGARPGPLLAARRAPLTCTDNEDPQWYALRIRSNFDFKIQCSLDGLQIESFVPCWTEDVRWSDRTRSIKRPLFSGYVFVKTANREDLLAALRVTGVIQVLPSSFAPVPVDAAEMEMVKRVVASKLHSAPCSYVAGELVLIDSGPLAGVSGVVVRTRGAVHVVVSIELLRRSVRVELDADTLVRSGTTQEI